MTGDAKEPNMTAAEAADIVLSEFSGDDRPATVEMIARLYSTLFAQNEATLAMFSLVMKIEPGLIFQDGFAELRGELARSANRLTQDVIELANSREDPNG